MKFEKIHLVQSFCLSKKMVRKGSKVTADMGTAEVSFGWQGTGSHTDPAQTDWD